MAIETKCQTPGSQFHIGIHDYLEPDEKFQSEIEILIEVSTKLGLDEEGAKLLEANIHNALELVLAPYFK